jgi:hypothetical protein
MSAINGTGVRASVHIISASVVEKNQLYMILAGVPGVALDDQWRNKIEFLSCIIKGLNNLWNCVTVKCAPCYPRKNLVLAQNKQTCKKKDTAS